MPEVTSRGKKKNVRLHDLILQSAGRFPGAVAALESGRQRRYAELAEAVFRTTSGFRRLGLKPADRVAIYLDKRIETVLAAFAVWSGDIVRLDEDGFLYFVGRNDDMIKCGGVRISPTEIEEVLGAMEGVREVTAFAMPDEELGSRIIAALVVEKEYGFSEARLFAHCRRELPSFMLPGRIVLVDELPRSPNGKVDQAALRARLAEDEAKAGGGAP